MGHDMIVVRSDLQGLDLELKEFRSGARCPGTTRLHPQRKVQGHYVMFPFFLGASGSPLSLLGSSSGMDPPLPSALSAGTQAEWSGELSCHLQALAPPPPQARSGKSCRATHAGCHGRQ